MWMDMWVDTHCHLDALDAEALSAAERAAKAGVGLIVIPSVARGNFAEVAQLAASLAGQAVYALGIHPVYVPQADLGDLIALRVAVEAALLTGPDPRFVALGEIGLDFFVPSLTSAEMRDKQEYFFREQLKIARDFSLPVLLHVRRSQDVVLKHLRQIRPAGGIAHAFNGSMQQAHAYIDLGFKLGFGGAMTSARALQIRRLARDLPLDALVLETDAPDMAPSWLQGKSNSPEQLPAIGAVLADVRGVKVDSVALATKANARAALPRIAPLMAAPASPMI
jgi:TatD DNase family protein